MSIFTTAIASFALAAASFAVAPASAAQQGDTRSIKVRYGDLDLSRTADVARLNRRIAGAVKAVCGSYDLRNLPEATNARACRKEAIAAAGPKVKLAVARANGGNRLAAALPAGGTAIR